MKPTKSHHQFRAELLKLYLEGSFPESTVKIDLGCIEYISINLLHRFFSFSVDLHYSDTVCLDCDMDDLQVRMTYPGQDKVNIGYLKTYLTVTNIVLSKAESILTWCKVDRYEWFSSHISTNRIRVSANNISQTILIYICPSIGWPSYDDIIKEYPVKEIPFSDFIDYSEKTWTEFVNLMNELVQMNIQISNAYEHGISRVIHDATQIVIRKLNSINNNKDLELDL